MPTARSEKCHLDLSLRPPHKFSEGAAGRARSRQPNSIRSQDPSSRGPNALYISLGM